MSRAQSAERRAERRAERAESGERRAQRAAESGERIESLVRSVDTSDNSGSVPPALLPALLERLSRLDYLAVRM